MIDEKKILFDFTADKIEFIEEPIIQKNDAGEEIKVLEKKEKKTPHRFALIKPNRAIRRDAEIHYHKTLSNCLREGFISRSTMLNKLTNDLNGNIYSEADIKRFDELKSQFAAANEKLQLLLQIKSENRTDEQKADFEKVSKEYYDIVGELNKYESYRESILSNTAEGFTSSKMLEWWNLQIAARVNEKDEIIPLFTGKFEERIKQYDDIYDSDDEFMQGVLKDFSFLITYWLTGNATTRADFEFALKKARESDNN